MTKTKKIALDIADKKILNLLQDNADININEISKQLNLSKTPCWARINKLYKNGVIKKKVVLVNKDKINLPIVAFVQVKTNQHNLGWAKKFIKVVEELEEVVEFYRLSGSIDYLLKIVVPSVSKFDEFYQDLTSKINLTDVTTSFSMDEIKHTNKLPLKYI
ncbi:Lrp/AsnC family transcriptional regulator [bacterium]|jgi:Lrp/AsnC family transcriptional regulator|nr:Lrp/AsnC family transcriptional regulator [bacterium]|tara:strand:- start:587 stop:1069 length:483 start_codon:yes stop_codon:yes gene_type:complete